MLTSRKMHPRLTAEELLLYADRLAAAVRAETTRAGLCPADALAAQVIALQLAKATFPYPEALFGVLLEAEGTMDLALNCDGDPC
jgi:hypothetical protein